MDWVHPPTARSVGRLLKLEIAATQTRIDIVLWLDGKPTLESRIGANPDA